MLLPFCFTGRALLRAQVYAPIDLPYMAEPLKDYAADFGVERVHNGTLSDLYSQIIPWQHAVRYSIARGEWPVWNPFLLCGTILAANMQAAPYDALNLLGLALPHPQALTFAAAMTFFLAALFTFAFARTLGCGELPALVAAAGYAFCQALAFFVGWPLGRAWAFLPLVLLGVRCVVRERRIALLTIGLVLTIFAGHPESILHIVACGAAFGVFELLVTREWRAIGHAAVAGALALAITAISLLPFLAAAPHTKEYAVRRDLYAPAQFPTIPEAIAKKAGHTFFPFYGGKPERDNFTPLWEPMSSRVGSLILGLALLAPFLVRRKETWFFLGLAIVGLSAALHAPPFAHLLHELPLFDIALNERLAYAAAFSLSVLAALALEAWSIHRPRMAALPLFAVGIALAIGMYVIRDEQLKVGVNASLLTEQTIADLVPLAIVALLLLVRTPPRFALPVLLGLLLVQRTIEDGAIYPTLPEDVFYPRLPVLAAIPQDGIFRTVGLHFALIPDGAAMYDLEDPRGYEAMTFRRLAETYPVWSHPQAISFNIVPEMWRPFLSFLNVRYAITSREVEPTPGWKLVLEDRDSRLLENTRVLPRAYVPARIRYEKSGSDVLVQMAKHDDFAQKAWITAPHYPPHEVDNGPGTVAIRRLGLNGYDLDVTMEREGWVVVSESLWPGWRTYVDGHRIQPLYANHAFLGVFVPAGKHHVRIVYMPESFTRGRNVSLATLAGLALFFGVRRFRKRTR